MDRKYMEDYAKLYAPAASRLIARQQWDQATVALLERVKALDVALQSLTPGGSEYVGDPDRCVAYVQDVIDRGRRAQADLARLRSAKA